MSGASSSDVGQCHTQVIDLVTSHWDVKPIKLGGVIGYYWNTLSQW